MQRSIRFVLIVAALEWIACAGCASGPAQSSRPGFPPPCRLLPDASPPADTVTVALADRIDPAHAPRGRTAGERMLFRHLYETLISIDCLGRPHPALAASWKSLDAGRSWLIELRPGARFSDASPVTAQDVARGWREALPGTLSEAGIDSVAAVDARTLRIRLTHAAGGIPRTLADPSLAIAGPRTNAGLPPGTGPYRIDASRPGGRGRPLLALPSPGGSGPVIRFVPSGARDPRDLLDEGTDLLITEDPAVIDYAAAREDIDALALPWSRLYVLLSTTRVRALQRGASPGSLPPDLAGRLAADAVRVEARIPRFPAGWEGVGECGTLRGLLGTPPPFPVGSLPGSRPRRIVYPRDDRVARDLAERILALGRRSPSDGQPPGALRSSVPGLTGMDRVAAVGLERMAFEAALGTGEEFAYVTSVAARPIDPCLELRRLVGRAPWIALEGVDLETIVLPLVETRRRVIAVRGRFGVAIDGLGDLRITAPGTGGSRAP